MRSRMTGMLVALALAGASGTAAAHSNVSFGISIGVPAYYAAPAPVYPYAPPPAVVYYRPAPVYYAPPPVYYGPRVYYGPPAFVIRAHRGFEHRRHWR